MVVRFRTACRSPRLATRRNLDQALGRCGVGRRVHSGLWARAATATPRQLHTEFARAVRFSRAHTHHYASAGGAVCPIVALIAPADAPSSSRQPSSLARSSVRGWLAGAGLGIAAAAAAALHPAFAQVAPPSASQVTPRNIGPEKAPTPGPSLAGGAPAAAASRAPAGSEALSIMPGRVDVVGGLEGLRTEELALSGRLSAHRISVAQIFDAAADLERAYARAGYILARVVVPPQELRDGGSVQITVINGYIESVDLAAVPETLRRPILNALAPLVHRGALRLPAIERRLTIAGEIPGASLRSTLKAGQYPGGSILVIEATSRSVSGNASFDNRLSQAFERREVNAQLALSSVGGFGEQIYGYVSGDPFETNGFTRRARRRVFGLGFSAPILGDGLQFNVETTNSVTQPSGSFIRTRGDFTRFTGRLTYPLLKSRREELAITGSFETTIERSAATDFGFDLYEDRYRVVRGAARYFLQQPGATISGSATLSQGWDPAPPYLPLSRAAAQAHFTKLEVRGGYDRALPFKLQAGLKFAGQAVLAGGLPSSEVFSLDGADQLSAFPAGQLSADQGVTVRAELRRPFSVAGGKLMLTPLAYAAVGRAWYAIPTFFDTRNAAALGVGLDVTSLAAIGGASPSFSLDYGHQATDGPFPDADRLSVTLTARF